MAQGNDEDEGLEFKDVAEEVTGTPPDDGLGPVNETPAEDIEVVLAPDAEEPAVDEGAAEEEKPEEAELVAEEAAPEDGLEKEDKTYSKSVRERIQREYRRAERAKEEATRTVMTERQARIDAERDSLETKKSLNEVLIVNLENELKQKSVELKKAKEDGDTDKEVELQGAISGLHARKFKLEDNKTDLERRVTDFEAKAKIETQPQRTEVSPTAQKWLDRNKWVAHKAFRAEAFYLGQLDRQLAQTLNPSDPRYFQELDRKIAEEMPQLKHKIQALTAAPSGKQSSAVAPRGRSAPGNSGTRPNNRVMLTREDLANMVEHKLDTKDPAVLKAYASEKRAMEKGN